MNTKNILFLMLIASFNILFLCGKEKGNDWRITTLKCEYATNPIGIDVTPQLSWAWESSKKDIKQHAYRIIVSTTLENLKRDSGDVWDSGRINTSKSTGIIYNGIELKSRQRYYWKVQAWDNHQKSKWSESAFFEMGLLKQEDWSSPWIGYVPGMPGRTLYFKSTFAPIKPIKEARVYIAGLGFYELFINKKKVGENVLDPGQSTYSKRVYYVTYDIADYLSEQANSIVVPVSAGWMGTARLRIQMEVTYQDGTINTLTTNNFRTVTTGPIVYSTIFDGELYDARLDIPDLHKPGVPQGMMNKQWAWAHNTDDPVGEMVAQKIEPIKVVEAFTPKSIKELKPGVYVLDAGRNLAGWVEIKVQGEEGTKVTLRYAETLYDNGSINQDNLRNAKAEDTYILRGEGIETWEPTFTYHGFRYVQVEGLKKPPSIEDFQIKVVRSAVREVGYFHCSNQLLNDIHQMVVNTEASNLHSVPTDCPQRDERMGWLNDLTVRIEQALYNFDFSRFFPKFMYDMQDTQDKDGTITCVAPFRFGMRPADPVSASYLLMPLKCYEFYGNKRMIADHFEGMKAWVDYLYKRTDQGIVNYSYYGDWCPPRDFLMNADGSGVSRDTPGKLMSTGYLYYCAKMLSDMANIIEKREEEIHYKQLSEEIYTAFNREYWNEQIGGYASNNQACNAFALYLGMPNEEQKPRVISNLVADVIKHNYHLTTGNLCTKYLMEVLTEHGHHEVAYKIVTQTTYPGWGYMLSKGATTLWERWEYATGDAMNSHNHPMMGSVDSWFYKYILGIKPDIQYPAFEQFTIKPYIFDKLTSAQGELITEKGVIKSAWKKSDTFILFDISIPANTTATVYVPTHEINSLTEGGKSIKKVKEITLLREEQGYAVFTFKSGNYKIKSKWKHSS